MDNPETRAELGTVNRAKTNKMKIRNNRKKNRKKSRPGTEPKSSRMVGSFFYDTRGVTHSQVR
jgi:hypothetical protein